MGLKELYNKLAHPSFHPKKVSHWVSQYENGYKVDRRIFITFLVFTFVYAIIVASQMNFVWKQQYLSCENGNGMPCYNALYGKCSEWYCQQELLPDGYHSGNKPSNAYNLFSVIMMITFFGTVVANHVIHNWKFNMELSK